MIEKVLRSLLLGVLGVLAAASQPAHGQDDIPPGVSLSTQYNPLDRPILAVRPFSRSSMTGSTIDREASDIIENDLRLSDRFRVLPAPASLTGMDSVPYSQWYSINVIYLVTGNVVRSPTGSALELTVHDVAYGQVKNTGTFALPAPDDPNYRMAVHALSDQVVQWVMNRPGMAATRIAYARKTQAGTFDLMIVDSDGQNERRIAGGYILYSPTWSPDGTKLAYTVKKENGLSDLIERDTRTGATRLLVRDESLVMTPAYSPDGQKIAFALWREGADLEIYEMDATGGQPRRLTDSGGDNLSPTYSADGRYLAFQSTRAGSLHIYVMPAGGGVAVPLTRPGARVEYAAPDWSPVDNTVVLHGKSRGTYQIMLADGGRPTGQLRQLTVDGWNEDPSLAPDGRHIVFTGEEPRARGLFVIDTETGERRLLARGTDLRMPDWSPSLASPTPVRVDVQRN